MKVLLIASNVAQTPYPVYPLGMAVIAKALTQAGHEVVQFDMLSCGVSMDALKDVLLKEKPDLAGISIRNIDNVNMMNEQRYIALVGEIVSYIKELCGINVVLGGSAFSILPDAILTRTGADYGIVGEGERVFTELLANAKNGQWPIEKLIYAGNKLEGSAIGGGQYDPDFLPFYLSHGQVANIQTKRGCIHECVYCTYPSLEGNRFRCREIKDVIADIRMLSDTHGAKMVFFTDSVFNDDHGYYLELVNAMKREGLTVPWTAFITPKGLDERTIDLMKETGLKAVELGTDASTDETLLGMRKCFTWADVVATNKLFTDRGVATAHYIMFGGPGETEATVLRGIKNVVALEKTVSFMFMGIRILPGTSLCDIAKREGIIADTDDLFDAKYYLAPGLDKTWLEKTMTEEFAKQRHTVFPPDAYENSVRFLHKMGHAGLLWEMLTPGRRRERKPKEPTI